MIELNQVGKFICKVESAEFKDVGEKKSPALVVTMVVTEGPCNGQSASINLWLDEVKVSDNDGLTCMQRTTAKLVEVFDFAGADEQQIVGKPCKIETAVEKYSPKEGKNAGKTFEAIKVKYLNKIGGSGGVKADMATTKVEGFRAKIAKGTAIQAKANGTPAPKIAGDGPPESDDVPF